MKETAISYGCLAVSVVVHGLAAFAHPRPGAPPRRPLLTELELAPVIRPEPLPRPVPPPAEPRVVAAAKTPRKALAAPPPPSPTAPEPPPTSPEPELTGRTLTAAAAGWSAPAGNGAERNPTIGVGAAAPRPMPAPAARLAPPSPVPVTQPFSALSRKPAPPSLAAALERNYPAEARRQGQSGEAKVRALIDAHGRATTVTVTFESFPGFGAACQRTLQQSRWTPPLGPRGEPTGTFVSYHCRFQVNE